MRLPKRLLIGLLAVVALVIGGGLVYVYFAFGATPAAVAQELAYMVSRIGKEPSPPPAPAVTRDERWRQDLRYLATELPRLHVDPFYRTGKTDFDAAVNDLDGRIPNLPDDQIKVALMRIVASLQDGHTDLYLPDDFRTYPIRVRWFGTDLHVIETARGFEGLLGARVLGVGSASTAAAFERLKPYKSAETPINLRARTQRLFRTPEVLVAAGLQPTLERGAFTLKLSDGTTKTLNLPGLPDRNLSWVQASQLTPLYLEQPDQSFWMKTLMPERTVFVKYNSCQDFEGFKRLTTEVLAVLDQKLADRVVVDLRGNGGGNSEVINPLIDGLKARAIARRKNGLYVLLDRGTFSSAADNLLDFRNSFPSAVFLGEPSGGALNDFGEVKNFKLPNSGLQLQYSTRRFELWPGHDGSFNPDVSLEPTIEDWLAGRDPVLEYALAQPR